MEHGQRVDHPADYLNAHFRHWRDAELLLQAKRWSNADQLYGFSAECGLKAVMKANGMTVDPTTGVPKERRHRKHIQELWGAFLSFNHPRQTGDFFHLLPQSNPFSAWSHHNRYANSKHFGESVVGPHREAALVVRRFCTRLLVSGHV